MLNKHKNTMIPCNFIQLRIFLFFIESSSKRCNLFNSINSYGSDEPEKLMRKFYETGNEMLLTLRNLTTSPTDRKKPRTWGATEAAKMVGVSAPTFRKLQKTETPGIIYENFNNKTSKKYTLEAINNLRDKAHTRYKRPNGSSALTIAVSNLKGGVGKTETSVDLAKKIAIEGLRCLLIDFDAQGTATLISSGLIPDMEIKYEETITNCLINDTSNIDKIILKTHFDGLDIIPANLAIQDCDLLLPNEKENNQAELGSPFERLSNALSLIKQKYDVILIDCGPNLGSLTLNAILACDGMLVPIPPNMNNYSSFVMYTSTLHNIFKEIENKKLQYFRILLSKHSGNNESLQMENLMREQFGRYILSNHMCETVEVAKAANEIGTIYDISKPRGSREAYRRAMQHLDDVNLEIINNFKDIWSHQSNQNTQTEGLANE